MTKLTRNDANSHLVHTVHTDADNAAISKAHVTDISKTAKQIGRSDRGAPKRGQGGKMGKEWR